MQCVPQTTEFLILHGTLKLQCGDLQANSPDFFSQQDIFYGSIIEVLIQLDCHRTPQANHKKIGVYHFIEHCKQSRLISDHKLVLMMNEKRNAQQLKKKMGLVKASKN